MYLKKLVFNLILYTIILTTTSLHSMEVPTHSTVGNQGHPVWASSANFIIDGKVAIDDKGTGLDSNKLLEWHISQAPQLADVYSNYQYGSGRNVAKALVSVVYTTQEGNTHIAHHPLRYVFINGWHLQDKAVGQSLLNRMRLDPSSLGRTKLGDIQSLFGIIPKNDTDNHIALLLKNNLISGFKNAEILMSQTKKYKNENQFQPNQIRKLKEEQTHSEKIILIYIDTYFDEIKNNLNIPKNSNIKYFIINIASYRDMCASCQGMNDPGNPLYEALMRIRTKVNDNFKTEHKEGINIKVIATGVAGDSGRPYYEETRKPIKIEENHHRVLYLTQNPLRPLSYQDFDTGEFMTTLVLNNNYLAYSGQGW